MCFRPAVKSLICCFPAIESSYVYIDFCEKVKTTKYMHVLYVDIPRMPFQNIFQACFDCANVFAGEEFESKLSEGYTNPDDYKVCRNI